MNPFEKGAFYKDEDFANLTIAEMQQRTLEVAMRQQQKREQEQKRILAEAEKSLTLPDATIANKPPAAATTPTVTGASQGLPTTADEQQAASQQGGINTKKLLTYGGIGLGVIIVIALVMRLKK